jgi:hypothetical protein
MPFLDDVEVLQVLSQGFNDFGELGLRIFLRVKFFKFVIEFMQCGLERDNFRGVDLTDDDLGK